MYGVLGYEKGHAFWPLWSYRHLLSLLASCQEVSHLQRTGPVQNQGMETCLTNFFCACLCSYVPVVKMFLFFFFNHRLRSVWFALTKRQPCSSSPAVTCAPVRVSQLPLSSHTTPLLSSPHVICLSSSQKSSFCHLNCQNITHHMTMIQIKTSRCAHTG